MEGNFIGTDVAGTGDLGNLLDGVAVTDGASNNVIGGTSSGPGNTIAFNGGDGVFVGAGSGNTILSNNIFSNTGLGIDLDSNGVTANDTGDSDAGANNLQNFPDIVSAQLGTNGAMVIEYSVDSAIGNSAYPLRIKLFKADADGQEGKTFLGSDSYPTDRAQGVKAVALFNAAALGVGAGDLIVATATDAANNTSEFSQAVQVTAVAASIPSLTHWGFIAMAVLMAGLFLWRKRRTTPRLLVPTRRD